MREIPRPPSKRSRRAFTLVEVLLVLALMALVGAVLLPAAGALLRDAGTDNPDDLVAMVLQAARRDAVISGRAVALRFDVRERRFVWSAGDDGAAEGGRRTDAVRRVVFLGAGREGSVLVRGRLVETGARPGMQFFPDGTCEATRLRIEPSSGAARTVAVDPWTCAPGLEVTP